MGSEMCIRDRHILVLLCDCFCRHFVASSPAYKDSTKFSQIAKYFGDRVLPSLIQRVAQCLDPIWPSARGLSDRDRSGSNHSTQIRKAQIASDYLIAAFNGTYCNSRGDACRFNASRRVCAMQDWGTNPLRWLCRFYVFDWTVCERRHFAISNY